MILAVIGYIGIIIAVFGDVLLPPQGQMILGDDIHRQYYFIRQFFNEWIGNGVFPWWNPYLFGGEPFIANPVVNIWYPPNWLFSVIPLNVAYSWHIAFHVFWACLGMYTLVRTVNRSQGNGNKEDGKNLWGLDMPAWVSGVLFGLSGFFMARTFAGHVDVIAAASWMPWVVWAYYRLIAVKAYRISERETRPGKIVSSEAFRYLSAASVIFALQLLAGYQTMAFFTAIAVGILTLLVCVRERSVRPAVPVLAAGIGAIGLAAFHLLPVQEFFRLGIRTYSSPYSWHWYGAMEWRSFAQFLDPFVFGHPLTYSGPPPNFIEHSAFVGIAGLILALLGGALGIRTLWSKAFLAVSVFGLWVSLGPNAPVDLQYLLWKTVPMYKYLRIPPRHLILAIFGLAGLAGIGGAFLEKFKVPKALMALLGGVIVIEMALFGRSLVDMQPVPEARHDTGLIAELTKDREPYRLLQNFGVWLPPRDVLDFNSVVAYGIFSATGYDPSIVRPYFEYVAQAAGTSGEKAFLSHDVQVPYLTPAAAGAIDRLNIKYILVPPDYDPFRGNPRYGLLRDDTQNGYRLYENSSVLPRFYPADPSCGKVEVTSYTPNRIELEMENSCDTTLMSSEVWYPGWAAFVDGKRTRINKENDVFRTLFVSRGKHVIVYRYVPTIFYIGLGITLSTIAGFIYLRRKSAR